MNFYHLLDIIFVIYLGRMLFFLIKAIGSKEKDRIKLQLLFFSISLVLALSIRFLLYPKH